MEEEYTIEQLQEIRRTQHEILDREPGNLDAASELICADALLCELNVRELGKSWKNAALCQEILYYLPAVEKLTRREGYPDAANMIINVCTRAAETLSGHPRLKHHLLKFALDVRISEGMEPDFELDKDVTYLATNILRANAGNFDKIQNRGHLKVDPVEWTEQWEECIHLAEEKADAELGDQPRGMGFCHAFWPTLRRILKEDYNIDWRSPNEMNPRVMFD